MVQFRVDYVASHVTIKSFEEFLNEFFEIHDLDYIRSDKFDEYLKSQYDAALIYLENSQNVIRLDSDYIDFDELGNYPDGQLITFAFPDMVKGAFYDKCEELSTNAYELRELIEERDKIERRIKKLTKRK